MMRREAQAHRARFLVVTVSSPAQVHPDPAFRRKFMEIWKADDLFLPERIMAEIGRRRGIEVMTLAPALLAHASRHGSYVHGFSNTRTGEGHWNVLGHRLAGEMIAEKICGQASEKAGGGRL